MQGTNFERIDIDELLRRGFIAPVPTDAPALKIERSAQAYKVLKRFTFKGTRALYEGDYLTTDKDGFFYYEGALNV